MPHIYAPVQSIDGNKVNLAGGAQFTTDLPNLFPVGWKVLIDLSIEPVRAHVFYENSDHAHASTITMTVYPFTTAVEMAGEGI